MSAQKVLEVAARQIGYKESPPNSNQNKYGAWYGMNHAPWCAMFVSYCFFVAGLPLPATTNKGFAYCPYGVDWFKKLDRWYSKPQVGDVVFFDWKKNGVAAHVGIVERVYDNGLVGTIEGNTSGSDNANGGMVMRRKRRSGEIMGYGRPPYGKNTAPSPNAKHPSWNGRYIFLTTPNMRGDDVRIWQEQMVHRGWELEVDGVFGEKSQEVLIQFQKEKGLDPDGKIGVITWDAAFELPITKV